MSIPWQSLFDEALSYTAFLDRHATPNQRQRFDARHQTISLTGQQVDLLKSFTRRMPILVLNAAWCGDCVNQCPIYDHFARASKAIDLRFIERDAHPALRAALAVNGGHRVPVVVFLSEDFHEVGRYGDRPLATYRALGRSQLGAACPTGLVAQPPDELAAVIQDWLDQFERAHWILRLSPRLRSLHGD